MICNYCGKDFNGKSEQVYCDSCIKIQKDYITYRESHEKIKNDILKGYELYTKAGKYLKHGFIYCYCIKSLSCNPTVVKIGQSTNPYKRIKRIRGGFPFETEVIFIIKETDIINEDIIHNELDKYRLNGEWFLYNEEVEGILYTIKDNYNLIYET